MPGQTRKLFSQMSGACFTGMMNGSLTKPFEILADAVDAVREELTAAVTEVEDHNARLTRLEAAMATRLSRMQRRAELGGAKRADDDPACICHGVPGDEPYCPKHGGEPMDPAPACTLKPPSDERTRKFQEFLGKAKAMVEAWPAWMKAEGDPKGEDRPWFQEASREIVDAPARPFKDMRASREPSARFGPDLREIAERWHAKLFPGAPLAFTKERRTEIKEGIEAACEEAVEAARKVYRNYLGVYDKSIATAILDLRQDRDRLQVALEKASDKHKAEVAGAREERNAAWSRISGLQSDLDAAKADATSLRSQLNVIGAWMLKHGCTVLEGESIGAATIRILEGRTAHAERKEREKGEWVRRHDTVSRENASLQAEVARLEKEVHGATALYEGAKADLAAAKENVRVTREILMDNRDKIALLTKDLAALREPVGAEEIEQAATDILYMIRGNDYTDPEHADVAYILRRIARPRVVSERDLLATIQHAYRDYKSGGADAFMSIGLISVLSGRIHAMLTEKGGTDDGDD